MTGAVRWAAAEDIPALAEVLSLAFPREFGQAFGASHKRRAVGVACILRHCFFRWRDALVFGRPEDIAGVALLCWEDSQPVAPLWKCVVPLGRANRWSRLPWTLFVLSFLIEERPEAGGCEIGVLAVRPDKRRQGVARALLAAAEEEARQRGCDHLSLSVAANNRPALSLYRKTGFAVAGRRFNPLGYPLFGSSVGLRMRKDLAQSRWHATSAA